MIKKGTILICNEEISDTTIGKEYLVIKDDTIKDDYGYERHMRHHVEYGRFSVKSLEIGDTFEHNGFVCRVESEVMKWAYNTKTNAYYKTSRKKEHLKEITDQEFIAQLEKYSH